MVRVPYSRIALNPKMFDRLPGVHRALQPVGQFAFAIPCMAMSILEADRPHPRGLARWILKTPGSLQIGKMQAESSHLCLDPNNRFRAFAQPLNVGKPGDIGEHAGGNGKSRIGLTSGFAPGGNRPVTIAR